MRSIWLIVTAMISSSAMAAEPAVTVPPATTGLSAACPPAKFDSSADIALLEGVVRAKAKDLAAAQEVATALAKIAQLYDCKTNLKAGAEARERLIAWFDTLELPKDGSPVAAIAAEARLELLRPAIKRELERKLVEGGKAVTDSKKALETWHDAVVGALVVQGKSARAAKGPALLDLLAKVASYNVAAASHQAGLHSGRLLMAISHQLSALAALEPADKQGPVVEQSKVYRDLAAAVWERHWKEADAPGRRDTWALEIRRELSVIKPGEFPPMDGKTEENLTPQQQEASKLASLAQRATKASLRVMYLKRALALDPDNPQLKELLRAAQANQAAEEK